MGGIAQGSGGSTVAGTLVTAGAAGNTTYNITYAEAAPKASDVDALALGLKAEVMLGMTGGTAVGAWTSVTGVNGTALGYRATAGTNSVAIGFENKATGTQSVAIGDGNNVIGTQSLAIGYRNIVSGNNSGAIGDPNIISGNESYAIGNNNTIVANNSFVLGNNVTIAAGNDNSVVLGNNSTSGGANTVSVGSDTNQRRITNVAPGVNPTDAANVSQLQGAQQQVVNQLNEVKQQVTNELKEVKRIAYSGAALAMAMSGNYMPSLAAGESALGVGLGNYKGQTAVGLSFKSLNEAGKATWGMSVSTTGKDWGLSGGVGWKWK